MVELTQQPAWGHTAQALATLPCLLFCWSEKTARQNTTWESLFELTVGGPRQGREGGQSSEHLVSHIESELREVRRTNALGSAHILLFSPESQTKNRSEQGGWVFSLLN